MFLLVTVNSAYDYLVVGGGTAGVLVTSRLKQYVPDSRIALLEAGPNAIDHPSINNVTELLDWDSQFQECLVINCSTKPQGCLDNREYLMLLGVYLPDLVVSMSECGYALRLQTSIFWPKELRRSDSSTKTCLSTANSSKRILILQPTRIILVLKDRFIQSEERHVR